MGGSVPGFYFYQLKGTLMIHRQLGVNLFSIR